MENLRVKEKQHFTFAKHTKDILSCMLKNAFKAINHTL